MLTIAVRGRDFFDEETQEFIQVGEVELQLEHSLVSLSKWESKHKKPFLSGKPSVEDTIEYIRCMILSPKFSPEEFSDISRAFTQENLDTVADYLNDKQTATWFYEPPGPKKKSSEVVTNELVYYWMFSAGIPLECETWNLNRLFTLLQIFGVKNGKPKKMGRAEQLAHQRHLNEQRQAQYGTEG